MKAITNISISKKGLNSMLEINEKQRVIVAVEGDEYILVKKADLEDWLQDSINLPEWESGLKWLEKQTGMRADYLKEKILYPYKEELYDFVDYPRDGQRLWRFNTLEMKKWLRKNFRRVLK